MFKFFLMGYLDFQIYLIKVDIFTPHLKWKKLFDNSSWDFEHVLDTMDDYWIGPDKNFYPESTPTRWRCYHFFPKVVEIKIWRHFEYKKTFTSVDEIFLGCAILKIWIFCLH